MLLFGDGSTPIITIFGGINWINIHQPPMTWVAFGYQDTIELLFFLVTLWLFNIAMV